ncbi:MAG: hypothetical protein GJT30_15920 [Geobacter sp.]|nr:hypothetical protein [Geobacter sp.]
MKGKEILNELNERRSSEHEFVKWWRIEDDFLDYDLIDRFADKVADDEEIGGLELLTMGEMWGEVKRVSGDRVHRVHGKTGDDVEWVHEGKSGVSTNVCPYTAETLINIYDVETHGNPIG